MEDSRDLSEADAYDAIAKVLGRILYELAAKASDSDDSEATIDAKETMEDEETIDDDVTCTVISVKELSNDSVSDVEVVATSPPQPPPPPPPSVSSRVLTPLAPTGDNEKTYTIAFKLPSQNTPAKLTIPFDTSFRIFLNKLQVISIPVAKELSGSSSTGFKLEVGPWFYSSVKGTGVNLRMEDQVRRLASNLHYLAMVSEMSRPEANYALFWHATSTRDTEDSDEPKCKRKEIAQVPR